MARRVAGAPKDHPPGHIGDATPQLAVDEVAHAPSGDAEGHERSDEVHEPQIRDVVPASGDHHGEHYAEQSTVERHAALPDGEDLERMREVVIGLVEEHV